MDLDDPEVIKKRLLENMARKKAMRMQNKVESIPLNPTQSESVSSDVVTPSTEHKEDIEPSKSPKSDTDGGTHESTPTMPLEEKEEGEISFEEGEVSTESQSSDKNSEGQEHTNNFRHTQHYPNNHRPRHSYRQNKHRKSADMPFIQNPPFYPQQPPMDYLAYMPYMQSFNTMYSNTQPYYGIQNGVLNPNYQFYYNAMYNQPYPPVQDSYQWMQPIGQTAQVEQAPYTSNFGQSATPFQTSSTPKESEELSREEPSDKASSLPPFEDHTSAPNGEDIPDIRTKTFQNKFELIVDLSDESSSEESHEDNKRSFEQVEPEETDLDVKRQKLSSEPSNTSSHKEITLKPSESAIKPVQEPLKPTSMSSKPIKSTDKSQVTESLMAKIKVRRKEVLSLYDEQEKLKHQLTSYQRALKTISLERREIEVQISIIKEFLNQKNYKLKTLRSKEFEFNKYLYNTEKRIQASDRNILNVQNLLESEIKSFERIDLDAKIKDELSKISKIPDRAEREKSKHLEELERDKQLRIKALELERNLLEKALRLLNANLQKMDSLIYEKTQLIATTMKQWSMGWVELFQEGRKDLLHRYKSKPVVSSVKKQFQWNENPLSMFKSYRLEKNFPFSFRSQTWSNRIDPYKVLCKFEFNGVCNDDACEFQHKRQYMMSDEEIIKELSMYAPIKESRVRVQTVSSFILDSLKPELTFEEKASQVVQSIHEIYQLDTDPKILVSFDEKPMTLQGISKRKAMSILHDTRVPKDSAKEKMSLNDKKEREESFIPLMYSPEDSKAIQSINSEERYFQVQKKAFVSNTHVDSMQESTPYRWILSCLEEISTVYPQNHSLSGLKHADYDLLDRCKIIIQKGLSRHTQSITLWYIYLYIIYLRNKRRKGPLPEVEAHILQMIPKSPSLLYVSSLINMDLDQRLEYLLDMRFSLLEVLNQKNVSVSQRNHAEFGMLVAYLEKLTLKAEFMTLPEIIHWFQQDILPSTGSTRYRLLTILSFLTYVHVEHFNFQTFLWMALYDDTSLILYWRTSKNAMMTRDLFEYSAQFFEQEPVALNLILINYYLFSLKQDMPMPFPIGNTLICSASCNILIVSEALDMVEPLLVSQWNQSNFDFKYVYFLIKAKIKHMESIDMFQLATIEKLLSAFSEVYSLDMHIQDLHMVHNVERIHALFIRILNLEGFRGGRAYRGELNMRDNKYERRDVIVDESFGECYNSSNPFLWLSFYVFCLVTRFYDQKYLSDLISTAHKALKENRRALKVFWKEILEWSMVLDNAYSMAHEFTDESQYRSLKLLNELLGHFPWTQSLTQRELELDINTDCDIDLHLLDFFKITDHHFLNEVVPFAFSVIQDPQKIDLYDQLLYFFPDNVEMALGASRLSFNKRQEYSYHQSSKFLKRTIRKSNGKIPGLWIELMRTETKIGSLETLAGIACESVQEMPQSQKLRKIHDKVMQLKDELSQAHPAKEKMT